MRAIASFVMLSKGPSCYQISTDRSHFFPSTSLEFASIQIVLGSSSNDTQIEEILAVLTSPKVNKWPLDTSKSQAYKTMTEYCTMQRQTTI